MYMKGYADKKSGGSDGRREEGTAGGRVKKVGNRMIGVKDGKTIKVIYILVLSILIATRRERLQWIAM